MMLVISLGELTEIAEIAAYHESNIVDDI